MSYQSGDVALNLGEKTYICRLTMGALCEINERLNIKGPLELARKITRANLADLGIIAEAVLRPCLGKSTALKPIVGQAKPIDLVLVFADLFERAFSDFNDLNTDPNTDIKTGVKSGVDFDVMSGTKESA